MASGAGAGAGAGAGVAAALCFPAVRFNVWTGLRGFTRTSSKLGSKYVFGPPPQPPAVLNTCICTFIEPHFEYTEYVFRM